VADALLGLVLRRHLVALLAGLLTAGAAAQTLSLRPLQHADGLENLAVTALAQDAAGRLWIGTENGLFCYGGERVEAVDDKLPPSADRVVGGLLADAHGRLWAGMRVGLQVQLPDAPGLQAVGSRPLPVDDGMALAAAPGGVWVVSSGDLLRVRWRDGAPASVDTVVKQAEAGRVVSVLAVQAAVQAAVPAAVPATQAAADAELWLGCGRGLCHWTPAGLHRLGTADGVPEGRWAGVLLARDGALWARSDARVLRRPPGAARFEDITPRGLAQGTVHIHLPMVEDRRGRVLVHSDVGLLRWEAGRWQAMAAAQGLEVAGGVHTMHLDGDGDLWLGTAGLGVLQWRGYADWQSWTRAQGLPSDEAWSFADADGARVWVGSGAGAALLDPARAAVVPRPRDSGQQVGSLLQGRGGWLWAATFSGEILRRRDGSGWQTVARGLPLVYQLLELPDGSLLAATRTGLLELRDAAQARPQLQRVQALDTLLGAKPEVTRLCATAAGVWLGTGAGLVLRLPDGQLRAQPVPGLPAGRITMLGCRRDGGVWAVFDAIDLWAVAPDGAGWRAQALRPALLERRSKVALLQDRRGWLWVGTDHGLVLQTPQGWRRFDASNGLVWNDTNAGALHEDLQGRLWVGTSRGVSLLADPTALAVATPLVLAVEAVRRGAQRWPRPQAVSLPWSREPMFVDWHLPGFSNRAAHRVSYRLGDDDAPWVAAGREGLRFDTLPPGEHRLAVVAENLDLGQRSAVATLRIDVLPPWWRTGPALAAAALLLLAAGLALHRWRLRALVRREAQLQAQLEEQVRLRTSDLEASRNEMRQLALTDGLTGAMNRRAIMEAAEREHGRVQRGEGPLTLALVDIDHFKRVNDTHGHPAGDQVLRQAAARLRAAMRPYDLLGRYGGEEFLVLLPGLHPETGAADPGLQRLRLAIAATPFDLGDGATLQVTCSVGAACIRPGDGTALDLLIDSADRALYRAKRAGRNAVELADRA